MFGYVDCLEFRKRIFLIFLLLRLYFFIFLRFRVCEVASVVIIREEVLAFVEVKVSDILFL